MNIKNISKSEKNKLRNNNMVERYIREYANACRAGINKLGKMQEYEYTPMQMAEKLLEFNRDFSDDTEDIQNEKKHVAVLFEKLQNSNEFNILAHYLDTMFMDEVFNK